MKKLFLTLSIVCLLFSQSFAFTPKKYTSYEEADNDYSACAGGLWAGTVLLLPIIGIFLVGIPVQVEVCNKIKAARDKLSPEALNETIKNPEFENAPIKNVKNSTRITRMTNSEEEDLKKQLEK